MRLFDRHFGFEITLQLPVNLAMKENLGSGLQLAMENCQRQFKWDPWNCPENVFSHGNRGWGSTREFAYVLAITSAAVDYVVTKNCSLGNIKGCGCNPNLNGNTGTGSRQIEFKKKKKRKFYLFVILSHVLHCRRRFYLGRLQRLSGLRRRRF